MSYLDLHRAAIRHAQKCQDSSGMGYHTHRDRDDGQIASVWNCPCGWFRWRTP